MKKYQQGFTLIELMIVVAIIGILAAIAIPAYQDYTIRAQVSEGPTLSGAIKTSMAEYFADRGTWPTLLGAGATGLNFTGAVSGNYVTGVTTAGAGEINVAYGGAKANAAIAGQVLSIRAALSANQDVVWICGNSAVPGGSTIVAGSVNATNLANKHMPKSCQP